jgi:hypothetical protein
MANAGTLRTDAGYGHKPLYLRRLMASREQNARLDVCMIMIVAAPH